jgi:hypothetical protein
MTLLTDLTFPLPTFFLFFLMETNTGATRAEILSDLSQIFELMKQTAQECFEMTEEFRNQEHSAASATQAMPRLGAFRTTILSRLNHFHGWEKSSKALLRQLQTQEPQQAPLEADAWLARGYDRKAATQMMRLALGQAKPAATSSGQGGNGSTDQASHRIDFASLPNFGGPMGCFGFSGVVMGASSRDRKMFAYYGVDGTLGVIRSDMCDSHSFNGFHHKLGKKSIGSSGKKLLAFSPDSRWFCYATKDTVFAIKTEGDPNAFAQSESALAAEYSFFAKKIDEYGEIRGVSFTEEQGLIVVHCQNAIVLVALPKAGKPAANVLMEGTFDDLSVSRNFIAAAKGNKVVFFMLTDGWQLQTTHLHEDESHIAFDRIEFLEPLPHPQQYGAVQEKPTRLFAWSPATASVRVLAVNDHGIATVTRKADFLIGNKGPRSIAIDPNCEYFAIGHLPLVSHDLNPQGVVSVFNIATCMPGSIAPSHNICDKPGVAISENTYCSDHQSGLTITPNFISFLTHPDMEHKIIVSHRCPAQVMMITLRKDEMK